MNLCALNAKNKRGLYRCQTWVTERWDVPIILTTTVQLLNTLFSGKTAAIRRMHNLSKSIIIFDEVQKIPNRCLHLFNSAMNFLSECCGATIILCTATQPELDKNEKPIRLSNPKDMVQNYNQLFKCFKRTEIIDETKHSSIASGMTCEELRDFILDKHITHKKILVILNTKKAALKLYKSVENKMPTSNLYYLSTDLCPAHRKTILQKLTGSKSNKNNPGILNEESTKIICISTQLIEAGVDVSFDCVIRSIAGLDSIAQAAGRCNRHGKQKLGEVYIVKFADENTKGLTDIEKGKQATERVLREFYKHPDKLDNDLLSPRAIEVYYNYYNSLLQETENVMDYPIDDANLSEPDSLFSLLSENNHSLNHNHRKSVRELNQSFGTAGKYFKVIDNETIPVLVAYRKEGKDIIDEFKQISSSSQLKDVRKLLKRAQQYTINIFNNNRQLDYTDRGIYQFGETGVYYTYMYDEKYGFSDDGFLYL